MLDLWNTVSLALFDFLLGWLLWLPRPVALVVVGLTSAGLIAIVRKWTTNQDRLRRAAADLVRLNELRAAAKLAQDKDALARQKTTKSQIGLLKLKAEGWPLVTYLLPLALLATWAFDRLEFYPPAADDTITVAVYLPPSAQEDLLHLVPQPGLHAVDGWVQPVHLEPNPPTAWDRFWAKIRFQELQPAEPDTIAIWHLQGEARPEPYRLVFHWKEYTLEHELRIGQPLYSPRLVANPQWQVRPGEPVSTVVHLRENRLFGIPSLGDWLPAWLVGYLLVIIPCVFLLKRWLGIF